MATIDYGMGEREFRCTYLTLTIYEQEFHDDKYSKVTGDLIADVFGKVRIDESMMGLEYDDDGMLSAITVDYTMDDWNVEKRALWAMLKTSSEIARLHGERDFPEVGSFKAWDKTLIECEPDLREVSRAVTAELQRGLFRSGAADSEETSEEE